MAARSRGWIGTFFPDEGVHETSSESETLDVWFQRAFTDIVGCNRAVGQFELAPSTGRRHLQFYIEFNNPLRFNTARARISPILAGTHLEPRTFKAGYSYCTKEITRSNGPFFFPEFFEPQQGKRTDLDDAINSLKSDGWDSVVDNFPCVLCKYPQGFKVLQSSYERRSRAVRRRLDVLVLWGPPGLGKTTLAYQYSPSLYRLSVPTRGDRLWWDGYMGEDTLLLDDFYGQIPITFMLNILDGFPLRINVKASHTYANYTKVIITSNVCPDEWYRSVDDPPVYGKVGTIPVQVLAAFKRRLNRVIEVTPENVSVLSLFAESPESSS